MAVFMKNARIMGAGPLMVIETEVVGAHRSKPEYSFFLSSTCGDRDAGIAELAVDVRPLVRVFAVERDRIEGRREPRRVLAARQVMETRVRALGRALAREHARRIRG